MLLEADISRAGYAARKAGPHHHRRKAKRKPTGMRPSLATGQRVSPPKTAPSSGAPPSFEPRPRTQQALPDLSHVRPDLIRVGLVSGITILIVIILWLVL